MPLYICNALNNTISEDAKRVIATDITEIHCKITGAPAAYVHVFFFDDAPRQPLNGKSVFLFGSIRSGRTDDQKRILAEQMHHSIHLNTGIPLDEIVVDTTDIPASWVMEGGEILPEPGEENNLLKERANVMN